MDDFVIDVNPAAADFKGLVEAFDGHVDPGTETAWIRQQHFHCPSFSIQIGCIFVPTYLRWPNCSKCRRDGVTPSCKRLVARRVSEGQRHLAGTQSLPP